MSSAAQEPSFLDRLDERPKIDSGKIAQTRPRELLYRFAAGALTSVISGAATLAFGPRVGGILLAFPAILAASLTLIEEQEDSLDAREDARGAIVGGVGWPRSPPSRPWRSAIWRAHWRLFSQPSPGPPPPLSATHCCGGDERVAAAFDLPQRPPRRGDCRS